MNLEDQVCSLELAKRLKQLGVKQKSLFYYDFAPHINNGIKLDNPILDFWNDLSMCPTRDIKDFISAFSVAELGELLQWEKLYIFGTPDDLKERFVNGIDNEANARAKMLIYLIENKLMELPK